MRDNHFYERLNQIRNKYGYNNQNEPAKTAPHNYYQPHNTAQTYRDVISQNNCSPQRITHQNTFNKNHVKSEMQKTYNMGISPHRNVDRQRSQYNITMREDRAILNTPREVQQNLNQSPYLDLKPTYKNMNNQNVSPSPIKKLRIECSYQSSPTKHDRMIEKTQDYQVLKPYNRIDYDPTPQYDKNTKEMPMTSAFKGQNRFVRPETPGTTKNAIRSYRNESPYDIKPPNTTRNSVNYQEPKSVPAMGSEQPMSKDSVFMQKFDYNVKNIQKIQDKINSILNRQK